MNIGKTLKNTKKINKTVIVFLRMLDKLQITVFSCIINRDFIANQQEYSSKLILQTRALMKMMQLIRMQFSDQDKLISRLENLYEIVFSLDLLKHRLFDHSTFEVCESELKSVSRSISEKIAEASVYIKTQSKPRIIKSREKPFCWSEQAVVSLQAFEALFQVTLQYITSDPMIFVFFIRNVKSLHDELISLCVDIQSLQNEIES